ncbi:MAG: hypothetical protein KAG53_10650 [Endozoicomonadaceae bacterium]|nr:hypothetical protein [Endozoicomonadaceae bacterium]
MNKTSVIFLVKNTEQYAEKCFGIVVTDSMDPVASLCVSMGSAGDAILWVIDVRLKRLSNGSVCYTATAIYALVRFA